MLRCSSVARSISDGGDLFDRSPSACSVEDKAALMLRFVTKQQLKITISKVI